ncbi:response regulator [filamentous cyanobacterium LEGE 11480]|uniref:Response regulator n=1 Tax=Romeriopsis navalis LEGE 11480 TaxID=2777977 RepID=A0A928VNY8_9CYAN|nr:response regulator [Romeriopsis navalis]MBE9029980.1 response regulator [Romeriopsis navalis LEGE 11480]
MATVLVVDDTLTEIEIITKTLQAAGFSTITANSSEVAKLKINEQRPDAIVLDIVLPGESGFELCRELKDDPATSTIPVILCSTKDSEMDKFWGLKQGAASYLTKPIVGEDLVRTMQALVK